MRFVLPKSEEQQARVVLFRARERLVHQRTELVNALRGMLYEFGHTFPQGIGHINRIDALLNEPDSDLPELVCEECRDLVAQIEEQTARIDAKSKKAKKLAAKTGAARRLQTLPGVGPLTALAIEAFAPHMESFKCGRDFAAWIGLVPKQYSSGGKERLGRVSKAGQADIRRLLIIGAMSRLTWRGRKSIRENSWLARMMTKKPKMLVAIALANKMARTIWAMLTKQEDYRDPELTAAA
jgi:transposase